MNMKSLIALVVTTWAIFLTACAASSGDKNVEEIEGVVEVVMLPGLQGMPSRRTFESRVHMITEDSVILLLLDENTEFVDSELPIGDLKLGHIYRTIASKVELPDGITVSIGRDVDEILLAERLERIGPPGPDAPTREKVRIKKAYENVPRFREVADGIDKIFAQLSGSNVPYVSPTIAFTGKDKTVSCGKEDGYLGMSYCPADQKIILDRDWIVTMEAGDGFYSSRIFDIEYMIAHVYAHHLQGISGIKRPQKKDNPSSSEWIRAFIDFELQADCLAGAAMARMNLAPIVEPGDIEESVGGARIVADEAMQAIPADHRQPENFTYGTSKMRSSAILEGFQNKNFEICL